MRLDSVQLKEEQQIEGKMRSDPFRMKMKNISSEVVVADDDEWIENEYIKNFSFY